MITVISLQTLVKNVKAYRGKQFKLLYEERKIPKRDSYFPFVSGFIFSFEDISFEISPHTGNSILIIKMKFIENKNNKSKVISKFYSSKTDSHSLNIFDNKIKENTTMYQGNTFNCINHLDILTSTFAKEPVFQILNNN